MGHFKSGADVVVVEAVADFRVGDKHTVDYVDRYGRVWLDCGGWLQAKRLRLVEQDDPLPPAPESVRYYDDLGTKWGYLDAHLDKIRGQRVVLALNADKDLLLLSADAALQLAHDLNRMANEIKRRERAQSGE